QQAWLHYPLKLLSNFGEKEALLLIFLGVLAFYNKVELALTALAAALGGALLSSLIKFAVGRARPDALPDDGSSRSFPSGHATVMFAIAFVLARRFPRFRFAAYLGAAAIAATRVLLNKHYPSDVLAGAALGLAVGAASTSLSPMLRRLEQHSWPRIAALCIFVPVAIRMAVHPGMLQHVLCAVAIVAAVLMAGKMLKRRPGPNVEPTGADRAAERDPPADN
ncbi:MAG: phosphatase PAP2 family protein, partial [Planctomycetota bacterium]